MELFKKTLLVAVLGLVLVDASAMKRTHDQADAASYVAKEVRPGVYTLGIAEADNVVWGDLEYSRNTQGQWTYVDGRPVVDDYELSALRQVEPLVNRFIRAARRQASQAVNYVAANPHLATAVVAGATRTVIAGTPVNTGDAIGLAIEATLAAVTGSFVAKKAGSVYQWTAAKFAAAQAVLNNYANQRAYAQAHLEELAADKAQNQAYEDMIAAHHN